MMDRDDLRRRLIRSIIVDNREALEKLSDRDGERKAHLIKEKRTKEQARRQRDEPI